MAAVRQVRTIAFSGSTRITVDQEERVRAFVNHLKRRGAPHREHAYDRYVTGGAPGIDSVVADELLSVFPDSDHVIVIPAAPYNYPKVKDLLDRGARAIYMPQAASRSAAYRARNEKMVMLAGSLVAFPAGPEQRYKRSGTWMTVRIAQRNRLPVTVFPLDSWT